MLFNMRMLALTCS